MNNIVIEITRNNFCNPLLRWFLYPHGDYLHLVHHLFPSIPHYNLAKVHKILLSDEEYQKAHHCYGYFIASSPDYNSTLGEMYIKKQPKVEH